MHKKILLLLLSSVFIHLSIFAQNKTTENVAPRFRSVFQSLLTRNHFEKNIEANQTLKMPKILHHIWLGPHPIPKKCQICMEKTKTLHSDWKHILWHENHPLMKTLDPHVLAMVDAVENYGAKSDILRLEILRVYGGVYLDVDILALKKLDPFVYANDFFCGLERPGSICNAIIGSEPNHPLLKKMLKGIQVDRVKNEYNSILHETGPLMFTAKTFQHFRNPLFRKKACVYPLGIFFPHPSILSKISPTTFQLEKILPNSYTVHFIQHSWLPKK